jgi:7-keto-8-aminopelargonate synthetase-like enzyme
MGGTCSNNRGTSPVFYGYYVAFQSAFCVVWKQNGQAASFSVDVTPYVSKGTLSVVSVLVDEPTSGQRLQNVSGGWSHEVYCNHRMTEHRDDDTGSLRFYFRIL